MIEAVAFFLRFCIARYAAFGAYGTFGEMDQPGIIVDACGGFDEVYDWHCLLCNFGANAVESSRSCTNSWA